MPASDFSLVTLPTKCYSLMLRWDRVTRHNANGFSSVQIGDDVDGTQQEEFPIQTDPIDGPPAEVNIQFGLTINLGNYESARVDVGIRYPCDREKIAEAYKSAKEWCEKQIMEEVREIRSRS